jgi:hypothetical protein
MFPIKAKDVLPIEKLVIHSVAIRGQLGPIAVWVTNETNNGDRPGQQGQQGVNGEYNFRLSPRHWTKIYQGTHAPSQRKYQVLDFRDTPIVLRPGQVRSIYIHSTLEGDEAIVYDNSIPQTMRARQPQAGLVRRPRFEDDFVSIYSGKAHLSPTPFGQMPIWGWGNAWRDHREFVGQLQYGIVYKLWNPELHHRFGGNYQDSVQSLLACQRRFESPVSMLPDECLFYILNMCRWDWFQDTPVTLKNQRRARKRTLRLVAEQARVERERLAEEAAVAAAAAAPAPVPPQAAVVETNARSCCDQLLSSAGNNSGNNRNNRDVDGDEEFYDAEERPRDADADADIEDDEDDDDEEEAEARAMMIVARAGPEANGSGSDSDSSEGFVDNDEDDDDDDDDDDDEWIEDVADMNGVQVQVQDAAADEDDESEWERQNGYRADNFNFNFRDVSSDEEEDEEEGEGNAAAERQAWFRRHFARVHILRGLAQGEQDVVVDMNLGE